MQKDRKVDFNAYCEALCNCSVDVDLKEGAFGALLSPLLLFDFAFNRSEK